MSNVHNMLKLTNVVRGLEDEIVIINPRYIMSIYETERNDGQKVTVVYSALKESWEVKETPEKIWWMINGLGQDI